MLADYYAIKIILSNQYSYQVPNDLEIIFSWWKHFI